MTEQERRILACHADLDAPVGTSGQFVLEFGLILAGFLEIGSDAKLRLTDAGRASMSHPQEWGGQQP